MAGTTIDIIYRFLADTKQYEQQIKNMGNAVDPSKVAPVDFSRFEETFNGIKGFHQELNRLVKTQQISANEAKRLRTEYDALKKDAAEISRILSSTPKGGFAAAFTASRSRGTNSSAQQGYAGNTQEDINRLTRDAALFDRAYNNTFMRVGKKVVDMRTGLKATTATFKQFGQLSREELEKLANTTQKPVKGMKQIGLELSALVRQFRGFARVGSAMTQLGTTFGILGAAITGGGFKLASDYIKSVEEGVTGASETSREWNKQMEAIKKSSLQIGAVVAKQTVPLLERGAQILAKVAAFIEKNPEMVGTAMKAGLVITGLSAIVGFIGKGITLTTDVAFLLAAKEVAFAGEEMAGAATGMNVAADKFVGATAAMNGGAGGKAAAGAAGIGLGGAAIVAAVVAAAAIGTDKIFDTIQKRDVKMGDYITELKQMLSFSAGGAGMLSQKMFNSLVPKSFEIQGDRGLEWFGKVAKALGLIEKPANAAADALTGLSDVLANSLKRDEALKAFEQYKADDLELLRKYYADRKKIEVDAQADILKANENLARGIAKALQDQANAISKANADYKADEEKAAAKYNEDRRKILQDAGDEILKLEADLQEKLRKLKMDYEERETELVAQRDAVGLIKNRKKYLQDVAEAQRETNREIAERRAEIGKRLKELQREYELERAQRYNDWVAKIKEIQTQTQEEIKQLRAKHAEELKQIQIDRNNKLKELNISLVEERKRRYNAFIAQIRDLDAALLGETNRKKQYYSLMLKDLDAFLAKYRAGMASMQAAVPSKQVGGYVNGGLYRLHSGEYVLNPGTTSILESMLGRKLTQSAVLQAVGGGSRNTVVWNDSRRFDSRLQPSDRRMIAQDTLGLLQGVIGG